MVAVWSTRHKQYNANCTNDKTRVYWQTAVELGELVRVIDQARGWKLGTTWYVPRVTRDQLPRNL